LHRHSCFDSADEARSFVALLARRSEPGMAIAICLDEKRRLLDFRPVAGGGDHLADVLAFVQVLGHEETQAVLLLSDRSEEVMADRPDDELVWEELVGQATAAGLVLLDWWVLFGTQAFSIAEHAPTPAAW
jgi:hypothetical protein